MTMNPNHFKSSLSLDDMKEQHTYALKKAFPWIKESIIERNLSFIELLNDYNWTSFLGIYDFLEDKWYNVESINLNNSQKKAYDKDTIEKVKSGKILIWFKVFIENYWTEKQDTLVYDVLAKKKNKIDFEKIKNSINNILSNWSFSSKWI